MGSNCHSVGSRTVKGRGEPNNQVARSSEKFSAINLQILSNIVRDYFPFLLGYPRSPVFTSCIRRNCCRGES
ncbi:unknown protein [Microcystis aeruginosa NIES-843]|uniref:Uncharacterized protein n=1 Tax=Microcystis aeruginosa (strain NIES-843 / IAM M-2473) TaxID=449447 RepID=B0JU42_MICAN|nr:unknown protein [Microcystis aeruginosa NIES-843]